MNGDAAAEARRLYARRDKLERQLRDVDARLKLLRREYMADTGVYGIHPTAFRHAVETIRKTA